MTKTELQIALATATQTDKRTAGVFLDTLSNLAYKAIKKNGEFVLPGFGKLVKQKRKARTGFNPKTQQKIKIPAKTVVKFRVAKVAKDAILGVKNHTVCLSVGSESAYFRRVELSILAGSHLRKVAPCRS
jgi:DNA-binding protein HU-beta